MNPEWLHFGSAFVLLITSMWSMLGLRNVKSTGEFVLSVLLMFVLMGFALLNAQAFFIYQELLR